MRRKVIVPLKPLLLIVFTASAMLSLVLPSPCQAQTKHPNGWYWPAATSEPGGLIGWLVLNPKNNKYHLGQDFKSNVGDAVYALADGVVLYSRTDVSGYGPGDKEGGALVALFKTSTGEEFKALYGHINKPLSEGSSIKAGEILGYINEYDPPHLHFGIHPGKELPPDGNPWRGYTEDKGNTYGWVDPLAFLNNNHPPSPPAPSQLELKLKWRVYTGFAYSIQMTKDAIFVGSFGDNPDEPDPFDGLYAISPLTGKLLWNFSVKKGVLNSAAGDIDGDGRIEVVVKGLDGYVYCLSDSGTPKWKFKAEVEAVVIKGAHVLVRPLLAIEDIDGDGKSEVVTCGWASEESPFVYCLSNSGILKWKFKTDGLLPSSLAIGDIDGDGESEVVVSFALGGYVYCLSNSGILKWEARIWKEKWEELSEEKRIAFAFLFVCRPRSSPTIGDIDGDGKLDVVGSGYVLSDSGALKWKFETGGEEFAELLPFPSAIGDMDGDGKLEVVFAGSDEHLYAFDALRTGRVVWAKAYGDSWNTGHLENALSYGEYAASGFPGIWTPGLKISCDVNGDGKVDIFDLALVGQNFEKKTKEVDVNGDGVVDIFDLVLVGQHFGEKYK